MAKKKFSAGLTVLSCFLALVIGFAAAFFLYTYIKRPTGGDTYISGDLSIHFMELGNNYTGDSIYIKAGDTDILIDAGSRADSTDTTAAYIDQYCTDGVLEYVIATHADQDHIAGLRAAIHRRVCSTDLPAKQLSRLTLLIKKWKLRAVTLRCMLNMLTNYKKQ